jgi:hypothetical protein
VSCGSIVEVSYAKNTIVESGNRKGDMSFLTLDPPVKHKL